MDEKPPRRILSLKNPPPPKPAPPPTWKCKPCGAVVPITGTESAEAEVRCPKCNARLGLAGDFNANPPRTEKVRARASRPAG